MWGMTDVIITRDYMPNLLHRSLLIVTPLRNLLELTAFIGVCVLIYYILCVGTK
jgi:hypothetical protein